MAKPTQKTRATAPRVYDELRRQIITLEIKPGADLDENTLVEKFGVSRTPVREALIRLSAEGLVEIRRNRGATVTVLDLEMLRSIFEAGDFIERAYTRLACLRRTDADLEAMGQSVEEFALAMRRADVAAMVQANTRLHLQVASASRNKYFIDCYRRILADHERIAQLWYSHTLEREDASTNAKILAQHNALLTAIADRDQQAAEAVSLEHAELCKDGVHGLITSGVRVLSDMVIETPGEDCARGF